MYEAAGSNPYIMNQNNFSNNDNPFEQSWVESVESQDSDQVTKVLQGFGVTSENRDSSRSEKIIKDLGSLLKKMGLLDGQQLDSQAIGQVEELLSNPLDAPAAYAGEVDALAGEWDPLVDDESETSPAELDGDERRAARHAGTSEAEILGQQRRDSRGGRLESDAPAMTDPAMTDPAMTDPAMTDPAMTDPAMTDPAMTDPAMTDPVMTDPAMTDPAMTDPAIAQPEMSDPAIAQPVVQQPVAQEPIAPVPGLQVDKTAQTPPSIATRPSSGTVVYKNDFSQLPNGTPSLGQEGEYKELLGKNVVYLKGFGADSQKDGSADEAGREQAGQINTASDQVRLAGVDGALRVTYPEGGNTSSHSGVQFVDKIEGSPDEVLVSYKVRFNDDFPWQHGGKLPGVTSKTSFEGREDLTSTRLMWREDGKLEFYIHSPHDDRERLPWDNGDAGLGHVSAQKGEWQEITFRVKLNSVKDGKPVADGELEGWINGQHAGSYTDLKLRGDENTNINTLFFSTFYGGSSGDGSTPWWPSADSTADFDDLEVVAL